MSAPNPQAAENMAWFMANRHDSEQLGGGYRVRVWPDGASTPCVGIAPTFDAALAMARIASDAPPLGLFEQGHKLIGARARDMLTPRAPAPNDAPTPTAAPGEVSDADVRRAADAYRMAFRWTERETQLVDVPQELSDALRRVLAADRAALLAQRDDAERDAVEHLTRYESLAAWRAGLMELLVNAGFPAGDRDQITRNVEALLAQRAADAGEIERLREDAARLDWYNTEGLRKWVVKYHRKDGSVAWQFGDKVYPDIRAAIDASRAPAATEAP